MSDTLFGLLDRLPARDELERWWHAQGPSSQPGRVSAHGLPTPALPVLLSWMADRSKRPVLAIVGDPETAFGETQSWFRADLRAYVFPAIETLPFDRLAPDEETVRRRLEAVDALERGGPLIVYTSWIAMTRPTLAAAALRTWSFTLEAGSQYQVDDLLRKLVTLGFRREPLVQQRGEFSLRGGILDVFPAGVRRPVRAEFFGDELESLREFDVETQGSIGPVSEVRVLPAAELILTPEAIARASSRLQQLDFRDTLAEVKDQWLGDIERLRANAYFDGIEGFQAYLEPSCPTLLDHLPADALVVTVDGVRTMAQAEDRERELIELVDMEVERGELPGNLETGLVPVVALRERIEGRRTLDVTRTEAPGSVDLGFTSVDAYTGRIEAFTDHVREQTRGGERILVVTQQAARLRELLEDRDLYPAAGLFVPRQAEIVPGLIIIGNQPVAQGFTIPSLQLEVYGDTDLFGGLRQRVRRGVVRARANTWTLDFEPGDLVVHVDHGIGRFMGMKLMGEADELREYMQLEYADGNKLYIPVEHLERVQKYVGGGDADPKLSKLGSGEWERAKRKVRESVEEVAHDLLDLYSKRQLVEGHAFSEDGPWQQELEQSFPYEETTDQVRAMAEIKQDMEDARPMDRLLAGDVGFGKTELAVRAAFKAVQDSKQVAILVPTTVLAQQHYLTFQERFRPFPVRVEMLSRFRTDAEAHDIIRRLRTGEIDVVIGTHRLLQKDVQFKDLGLVILDEEQRFGVMQKEKLKQLRASVDVLSLSATPIPRTLHMSLAGIRDLSVIQTPPEERLPIKTFVTADDDDLIREVIQRELQRGGQVFYVYNRVQTIRKAEERVKKLVPQARVLVGHGQMPEHTLADVMERFVRGEADVLVCSTIIESGLDIPNANTIIVVDAHRMGLAQLYQLRGRVGRAGQRAYAYFLYNPTRSFTENADKRLDVIAELHDLGSGFKLALKDLEIRGAGNLLGVEQHGAIAAVGLELYNSMLREAVESQKSGAPIEIPPTLSLDLPLEHFLPREYVPDEKLRLQVYQDLAAVEDEDALENAEVNLRDRFGQPPGPVRNLLYALRVKLLARRARLTAIETDGDWLVLRLPADWSGDPRRLESQFRSILHVRFGKVRISVRQAGKEWKERLLDVLGEVERLGRLEVAAAG
ncbi:MAG TPA: transcription-repair coupling factor [Candidatus Limnocylindrales bacterium]|nr:transcription-repair coupling factor [Candidatus Limnocylindrales bacterium]